MNRGPWYSLWELELSNTSLLKKSDMYMSIDELNHPIQNDREIRRYLICTKTRLTSVAACSSFRLLFLLSCITAFGATSLLFVVELNTSLHTWAGRNPLADILPLPVLLIGFCAIIAACFLIWIKWFLLLRLKIQAKMTFSENIFYQKEPIISIKIHVSEGIVALLWFFSKNVMFWNNVRGTGDKGVVVGVI